MIGQQPTIETQSDFRPGTLRTWQFGTYGPGPVRVDPQDEHFRSASAWEY